MFIGIKELFNKICFGKCNSYDTGVEIVDGKVVINREHAEIMQVSVYCTRYATVGSLVEIVNDWITGKQTNEYQCFMHGIGRADRTISEYVYELNHFVRTNDLKSITQAEVESCLVGISPKAAKRRLSALRSYARWLKRFGYPALYLKISEIKVKGCTR
jgi:hypothetical protein